MEEEHAPPLFMLTGVLLRVVTPSALRSVVLDFIETVVPTAPSLQSFLVSSFSPQLAAPQTFEDFLEQETAGGEHGGTSISPSSLWNPTGRHILEIIDALLEQCTDGGAAAPSSASAQKGHERFWFAAHVISAMLIDNADVAGAAAVLPIDVPQDYATKPTQLLDRMLDFFPALAARVLKVGAGDQTTTPPPNPTTRRPGVKLDALSDSDFTEQSSLLAILHLFIAWFSANPQPFTRLTTSPVLLPVLISLACLPAIQTDLGRLIEGAACLLLGIALTSGGENHIPQDSIMTAIAGRIGVESFCAGLDFPTETLGFRKALRAHKGGSRAALRPDEFRWFGPYLASTIERVKSATRRQMVALYFQIFQMPAYLKIVID